MIQKTNHLSKSVSLSVPLRTFARGSAESVSAHGTSLGRLADTPTCPTKPWRSRSLRSAKPRHDVEKQMRGKTCVITGATSGIGKAAAFALASLGASLIMVGRNEDRGAWVQRELRLRCPTTPVDFYRGDLSALDDVRSLAGAIKARHDRIDVLINNAGARFDDHHESADGFELTLATNHLGHFLLTCLLGDRLLATRSARVITVSSGAHFAASPDGVWSYPKNGYDRRLAYAKSKLANILFATELARRLKSTGVTSNALHPGGVATNFARNNGLLSWLKHIVAHGIKGELISPAEGAKTIVYLAADNQAAGFNGQYFFRCRPIDPARSAMDWTLAKKLWSSSLQWTKLDASIGIAWKYFEPSF